MSSKSLARGFTGFLDTIGSALAVSAAARQYRQPADTDLKRLGIDPTQFHGIPRY